MSKGPIDPADLERCIDDTLPPDHIKLLATEGAVVFRLDLESETAVAVASWPEKPSD